MKIDEKWTCRLIETVEEAQVYDLILNIFHRFVAPTYFKDGIDTFNKMLSPSFFEEKNRYKFTIILTIISVNHIALLFVDSEFQRQGIGKNLIKTGIDMCLKEHPDLKTITVSSSPNSISFYKYVGFEIIRNEKDENGMRFIPMEKRLANREVCFSFSSQ